MPILADFPPDAGQRVHVLYAWIATHPDGSEGIMSADLPMFEGMRHVPLLSSKRHVVENMRDLVEQIVSMSVAAGTPIKYELRTYRIEI